MRAWSLLPLTLAALEILHPTWSDTAVSDAVRSSAAWWIVLHVLLLLGYAGLVVVFLRIARSTAERAMLIAFGIANSMYLAIDGIAIGVLAQLDPVAADVVWSSTWVTLLADGSGATWAAVLLLLAVRSSASLALRVGAGVTWLAFVASALPALGGPAIGVSRSAALATGAWAVYQRGSVAIPLAMLAFAAVLRQHVGAEAAFGLVLVAIATGRSSPAAASPPGPG